MSATMGLLLGLVLLLANGFFVGSEFALVSARRSQIEPAAQAGSQMARITLRAMENISLMMAGAQLGITVCSVLLLAITEPALAHLLEPGFDLIGLPEAFHHPVAFVIAMLVVTYLHVVVGEMVPKNIALAGPDKAALVLGPAIYAIVYVLRPIIVAFNYVANVCVRALGIEPKDEVSSAFTRAEVAAMVEESRGEGLLEEDEYGRLAGALGFTEKTVAKVTIPISDWTIVPRGASGSDIEAVCATTGYSRFPVADEGGDLVGYLHIKDVLEPDDVRRRQPVQNKWIRPFATVTPDDALHETLETLQRRGAHLARVVREDGSTIGLATLEDVIEELVGEIRDAAHADDSATTE
ncbi:hemolysin family protein [Nocardioides sp. NPDC126508]